MLYILHFDPCPQLLFRKARWIWAQIKYVKMQVKVELPCFACNKFKLYDMIGYEKARWPDLQSYSELTPDPQIMFHSTGRCCRPPDVPGSLLLIFCTVVVFFFGRLYWLSPRSNSRGSPLLSGHIYTHASCMTKMVKKKCNVVKSKLFTDVPKHCIQIMRPFTSCDKVVAVKILYL